MAAHPSTQRFLIDANKNDYCTMFCRDAGKMQT